MQLIAQSVYLGPEPVPFPVHQFQHCGLILHDYRRQLMGITEHHAGDSLGIQAVVLILLAGTGGSLEQ